MTIPQIFTKLKRKVENNTHLDERSKLIVLHILRQVFKEIPKEDLVYDEENIDNSEYKGNPENMDAFNELFGDIFKDEK